MDTVEGILIGYAGLVSFALLWRAAFAWGQHRGPWATVAGGMPLRAAGVALHLWLLLGCILVALDHTFAPHLELPLGLDKIYAGVSLILFAIWGATEWRR
jgi:hypothetical protein